VNALSPQCPRAEVTNILIADVSREAVVAQKRPLVMFVDMAAFAENMIFEIGNLFPFWT